MINVQVYFSNSYITSFFNSRLISDVAVSKQRLTESVNSALIEFIFTTFKDITGDNVEFDIKFSNCVNDTNISCAFWLDGVQIPINLESVVFSVVEDKSWVTEYDEYIIIYNTYNPIIMRSYSDGTVKIFNKEVGEHGITRLVEQTAVRDRLLLKSICKTVIDTLDPLDLIK